MYGDNHIRWGIIAPGKIAEQFAAAMTVVENSEIIAIASRSEVRAEYFARKFAVQRIHANYADLVSDPEIDAVYVASPHAFHAEQTLLCLRNKKAVLCEKPLAVNAKQVRSLIETAQQNNVFFMEAMWTRFLPTIREVHAHLKSIGKINRIQADFSFNRPLPKGHRCINPDLAGGSLLDLGVYVLTFARIFTNDWPQDSASFVQLGETGVDLQATMMLKYTNGLIAQLSCGLNVRGSCMATIYGSKGVIEFPKNFFAAQEASIKNNMGKRIIHKPFRKNGFEHEIEEVNNCLREKRIESTIMTWDESLGIIEQMDAFRSNWGLVYPFE